jgi:hypothetical protein
MCAIGVTVGGWSMVAKLLKNIEMCHLSLVVSTGDGPVSGLAAVLPYS